MLKQQLNFKLSQKLSPQQIQLMKLIQLPTQAFEQRIKQEIEENPALETGKDEQRDEYDYEDKWSGEFKTFKSRQWTDQKGFPCYNFWDIDAEHPRTAVNYSVRKAEAV